MRTTPLSVCVFCGARDGNRPAYVAAARQTGQAIAAEGWRLVYGAGDIGLMGHVARSAQEAGAPTFGVIPRHLLARENGKRDLSAFIVTETMHERKKVMFMNCDVIVLLPGGAGSLDEFFEVLTWRQLGLHEKPIFLLDSEGFWAPLARLVQNVIDEGFAEPDLAEFFTLCPDVATLIDGVRGAFAPPTA